MVLVSEFLFTLKGVFLKGGHGLLTVLGAAGQVYLFKKGSTTKNMMFQHVCSEGIFTETCNSLCYSPSCFIWTGEGMSTDMDPHTINSVQELNGRTGPYHSEWVTGLELLPNCFLAFHTSCLASFPQSTVATESKSVQIAY